METIESQATTEAAEPSQPSEMPARRLVIRVKIVSEAPAQPAVPRPLNRRALALALGVAVVAALMLIWMVTSLVRSDSTPTASSGTAAVESGSALRPAAQNAAAPEVSSEPSSQRALSPSKTESPITPSLEPRSPDATSTVAEAHEQTEIAPSPIDEVIPEVPRSALRTIRGTVRVAIRVIIGTEGTVVSATSEAPGPSRYFERLSLEAAKKWTFTRANTEEQRVMLVRFYYTREGATARAELAP